MPTFAFNPSPAMLLSPEHPVIDYAILRRDTPNGRSPHVYIAWSRTREGPGRPDYSAAMADVRDMLSADGFARFSRILN